MQLNGDTKPGNWGKGWQGSYPSLCHILQVLSSIKTEGLDLWKSCTKFQVGIELRKLSVVLLYYTLKLPDAHTYSTYNRNILHTMSISKCFVCYWHQYLYLLFKLIHVGPLSDKNLCHSHYIYFNYITMGFVCLWSEQVGFWKLGTTILESHYKKFQLFIQC